MGEAPAFIMDDFQGDYSNGVHLKLKDYETALSIGGNRTYVIGATKNESESAFGIQIFDKSTGDWIIPTVLGTKPKPSKGHSAILLDEDRILVIKGNSSSDDCFWFLEVNTAFVRDKKKKLGAEVVAWSKGVTGDVGKPLVISGPSGVGKGTLIFKLMEEFPTMFGFSVSHTTRAPRNKEQNGAHYHFTERSVMERDIEDGKFLEFAAVHGNLYGTSIEAVEEVADKGKVLNKANKNRGTETEEHIQKRLLNAQAELEQGNSLGLFDHILVNDDLEMCYEDLKKLLGLNNGVQLTHHSFPELFDVPLEHTVSKTDQKILITCGAEAQEKSARKMFVLDLASIKGGAPGRTRGLNIYSAEPSTNVIIGTKLPR